MVNAVLNRWPGTGPMPTAWLQIRCICSRRVLRPSAACSKPPHMQQKSAPGGDADGIGETCQPVISDLIQAETGVARHQLGFDAATGRGASEQAPRLAGLRAAKPALAKRLQKAVNSAQRR